MRKTSRSVGRSTHLTPPYRRPAPRRRTVRQRLDLPPPLRRARRHTTLCAPPRKAPRHSEPSACVRNRTTCASSKLSLRARTTCAVPKAVLQAGRRVVATAPPPPAWGRSTSSLPGDPPGVGCRLGGWVPVNSIAALCSDAHFRGCKLPRLNPQLHSLRNGPHASVVPVRQSSANSHSRILRMRRSTWRPGQCRSVPSAPLVRAWLLALHPCDRRQASWSVPIELEAGGRRQLYSLPAPLSPCASRCVGRCTRQRLRPPP